VTPRDVEYLLGMTAFSAMFAEGIASVIEWVLGRFMAPGPRSIAISCFAAFVLLSVLLDPNLGVMAKPVVALGCCIVWWLRIRSFAKTGRGEVG
jgi:hypothetical protein